MNGYRARVQRHREELAQAAEARRGSQQGVSLFDWLAASLKPGRRVDGPLAQPSDEPTVRASDDG